MRRDALLPEVAGSMAGSGAKWGDLDSVSIKFTPSRRATRGDLPFRGEVKVDALQEQER
jgi:hypothetical protein